MEGRDKPLSDIYKEIINGWSHDAVCSYVENVQETSIQS
jgi:hypothetical protein